MDPSWVAWKARGLMPRVPPADPALAAALRRFRDARGLTQEQVAHEASITPGTLSKIETGETSPAWATVRQIARALGVSMRDLGEAVD